MVDSSNLMNAFVQQQVKNSICDVGAAFLWACIIQYAEHFQKSSWKVKSSFKSLVSICFLKNLLRPVAIDPTHSQVRTWNFFYLVFQASWS